MFSPKNLIYLLSVLLLNCQEPVESNVPGDLAPEERRYFVSATAGDQTSRATLQFLASGFGQPEVASLLKYDVDTYTLTYYTTYKGKQIEASGLIMVPKGSSGMLRLSAFSMAQPFSKIKRHQYGVVFRGWNFWLQPVTLH